MRIIRFFLFFLLQCISISLFAQNNEFTLKLIETTDVHGNFLGYDFMTDSPIKNGLNKVYTYVKTQREQMSENQVVLLDAGDILQGQPCVYFANFVDTLAEKHLAADVYNFMRYDVAVFGNHDIEAGHSVYDRWVRDCNFPVLGANILDTKTQKPYATPYVVIQRGGLKVAVLGLLTPAIPMWLPEKQWKGLAFGDVEEYARKWVSIIQKKEKPDLMIGLFHSGLDGEQRNGFYENAAEATAKHVPGFDIIFYGHDHRMMAKSVKNEKTNKDVWLLNSGNGAYRVAEANVVYTINKKKAKIQSIQGQLVSVTDLESDPDFTERYASNIENVRQFFGEKISKLGSPIHSSDYFFGGSTLADLLHATQFRWVDADISFVTPLTTDDIVPAGDICMRDAFRIYRFENLIDVFRLTGREVKGALEKSYELWTSNPNETGHVINITEQNGKARLGAYNSYLVSAAGIKYVVDPTKPAGQKVNILCMSDGKPFELDKEYRVAVNSYIGSGGGEIMTEGCGLTVTELPKRIIMTSEKDLRYYLIQYFKQVKNKDVIPSYCNWEFIQTPQVKEALVKDRELLFGKR